MITRGDHNDTNTTSTIEIRELMDDFRLSLIRLYTEDSSDSLDEIMGYFNQNEQEICFNTDCVRKESGVNHVRDYVKDNLMGKYNEAYITFQTRISSFSADNGAIIRIAVGQYLTEMLQNNTLKCEKLIMSEYLLFLNTDLEITKWINILPDTDDVVPEIDINCKPLDETAEDDEN